MFVNMKTTRRKFVEITPLAGLALLAACSPSPPPPAPLPPPSPAPEPTPAPPAAEATPPAGTGQAPTAGLPMASETSPNSVALSYVADASRVDTSRNPTFIPGSKCANCALFLGPPDAEAAPCPLFPGELVAGPGWCSAWARRG
jgi:hypothetical protein